MKICVIIALAELNSFDAFSFSKDLFGSTVEHDFNGHEVKGIHGVYGKKCYCSAEPFI